MYKIVKKGNTKENGGKRRNERKIQPKTIRYNTCSISSDNSGIVNLGRNHHNVYNGETTVSLKNHKRRKIKQMKQ